MTTSRVHPHPNGSRPVRSRLALSLLSALAVLAATLTTVSAAAEEADPIELPDAGSVDLSVGLATTTLYGRDANVTLDATNATGTDAYNLSFTATLPPDVAYVAGSAEVMDEPVAAPQQRVQEDGSTVLVWVNVSDLLSGASSALRFSMRPDVEVYDVGDSITIETGAYAHTDARTVPDFDPATGAATGDVTSHQLGNATTQLSPFDVRLTEPNAERELLRGAHDHQTIFTIALENNLVNASTGFAIVAHIPAGLEFLGCADVDHTTEGVVEYPGAPRLDGSAPAMGHPCIEPTTVATVTADPDAGGPLGTGVHTEVVWNSAALEGEFGSADLAPGQSVTFSYAATAPLRANVDTTLATTTANLDDNTGALTFDEQGMTSHVWATGVYHDDVDPSAAEGTEVVVAEDVSVHTSVSTGTIQQGGSSTWTLLIESSEYATATGPIVLTETVPDGLDVISSTHPYDAGYPSVNADGTITLRWTIAGFDAPNGVTTVAYDTVARTDYRATSLPVMAEDSWNSSTALATTADVMTGNDGSTTNLSIVDASGAGQRAGGISIAKSVAAPRADGLCGNGDGLTFDPTVAGPFRPGDRVCWRLTVDFPSALDTRAVLVQDHLPAGFVYEGHAPTTLDTVGGTVDVTETGSLLEWDLGDVDAGDQHFDLVVSTVITDPNAAQPADLTANLLKARHQNTAGSVFQHRDEADALWAEAILDLRHGVADVNDVAVASAPADGVAVRANDVVTVEVLVDNIGTTPALDAAVRALLPTDIGCDDIGAISDGGTCSLADGWIDWTTASDLDVAAGTTRVLSYDLTVPGGITAGVTLSADAGVRTYLGATNRGTTFDYVPAGNIDPTLTANTSAADDPTSITTPWPTLDKTRTTAIAESGNSASQATVGETIEYSIDVILPAGTTYYGPGVISDDLGSRLDLTDGTVAVTLAGGALPADWVVTTDDNRIRVTFGATHVVPVDADQVVEIEFDAVVTDVSNNRRGKSVRNTVKLHWDDQFGRGKNRSDSVNTAIVEPNLAITKAADDGDGVLEPAQVVTYTVTVANPAVSRVAAAHDVIVMDTAPAELTVLNADGEPAQTGDLVGPDAGVYNEANRTISWSVSSIARGGSVSFAYEARAADPLVASTVVANAVTATATSMAGDEAGERTPHSAHGGVGSGYRVDTVHGMFAPAVTVAKVASVGEATIGDTVDHTIDVTVPADTVAYDIVVMDDLPAGLEFDGLLNVACTSAGGACDPDLASATVLDGGHDVAFFIGDAAVPAADDRTIEITYRTYIRDPYSVYGGGVLPNTAYARHNATDRIAGVIGGYPWTSVFDHTSDSASAIVDVIEPSVTIDKSVDGQAGDTDARRAVPGETLTYTLVVTNQTGATVGPAHDLVVTDAIDARLLDFVDTTAAVGVASVDADLTDGDLAWTIAGPIAAGSSVTISYDVTVPADWGADEELPTASEVVNTADVAEYYGAAAEDRAAEPTRGFRRYTNVIADTVRVELDLASIGDRVWIDADRDRYQDADEVGAEGVDVTAVFHGSDGSFGTADDETFTTVTGIDGIWTIASLPGGRYTVLVDQGDLPEGMTPTFDLDYDIPDPDAAWSGWLGQNQDRTNADAGYALPPENTGLGYDEGNPVVDSEGNLWVVGLKPDGRAFVRSRAPEGDWSTWIQQGTGDWASMTINTDRAGNVWVAGVKNSGAVYVRTKDISVSVRDGWSQWVQQGSGGWASMALATDPAGNVWLAGVKTDGTAYVRSKTPTSAVDEGWSDWVHQGSKTWSTLTLATDSSGNVWLSGITPDSRAYVRTKLEGGEISANWSNWKKLGSSDDWVSMNISTDSHDGLWVVGVKESGTALIRQKGFDESIDAEWTSWHQLGSGNSWASMTLTIDDLDTVWVAGVKHSGTGYISMKCWCPGISEGWTRWWQQGSVNTWRSLTISTDPSNRVMLGGLKLNGTGYVRIKSVEAGVSIGWSNWMQQGSSGSWEMFEPHSNAWTGMQPPRNPTLGVQDVEWINPPGWTDATVSLSASGTMAWC